METLEDYLKRLASKDPVPGGGSAATLVASIGAALVAMVGRIMAAPVAELVSRAERLHLELNEARCRDEAAYAAVVAAQALPKRDDTERAARRNAIQAALHEAAREPLHAARLALEVLRLTRELVDAETRALASDVGCAAEFAYAAITACAYNVRINHRYMRATDIIAAQSAELAGYETAGLAVITRVRKATAKALEKT